MKKVLLAAATVALLFATSCKKDVNAPENIQLGENEFLATIDNGAVPQNAPTLRDGMNTMTTIDGDRRVFWESDDVIKINGVTYSTVTTGNPVIFAPATAGVTATPEADGKYHAFYPASIAGTGNTGTLPAVQTYTADIKVSNLPMYALGGADKQLTFHNICAVIKIEVPSFAANTDKIIISSEQQMNGSFRVDEDFKAVMIAPEDGLDDGDKMITMGTFQAGQTFSENSTVYIAVPAQAYTHFRIEFFDGNNLVWCKTLETCTLDVNKIYPITMKAMDYLCFTGMNDEATVTIDLNVAPPSVTIQYSRDGKNWGDYDAWTGSIPLQNEGNKVYFRASANHNEAFSYGFFQIEGYVEASGDIMSLYGPDCPNYIGLPDGAFTGLFQGCTGLMTAPKLTAPTLSACCYQSMFNGCSNLKEVYIYATDVDVSAAYYCLDGWLDDAGTDESVTTRTVHCKSAVKTAIEDASDGWTVTDDL